MIQLIETAATDEARRAWKVRRPQSAALLPFRFKPGQSGNPKGAPKRAVNIQELAKQQTEEAVATLVKWMRDPDPRYSLPACIALLDRGWGRPREQREAIPETVTGWDAMTMHDRIAVLRAQRGAQRDPSAAPPAQS